MIAEPFFRNALIAGTAIAIACGFAGYFLVQRGQIFTGDALSHVAFTGALAALAAGVDERLGLFVATVAFGVGVALLRTRGRSDDVAIGSAFAWILGLGVLFLALYTTSGNGANGPTGVSVLFGSIFGLTTGQARLAAIIAATTVVTLAAVARPLLFASLDEALAASRGVPVRILGVLFLSVVGLCAAEATQAVGALLLLGLLAAPAGAALLVTDRPYRAMALAPLLAVTAMWGGLATSYVERRIPPSVAIIGVASAVYLGARLISGRGRRPGRLPS